MIIIFSSQGDALDSKVDPRFGRCRQFIKYDIEQDSFEVLENAQSAQLMSGAGVQTAQLVVNNGAEAVVTGHCGPKAFMLLKAANVKVYTCEQETIAAAIDKFKRDELREISSPDVQSHW